LRYGGRAGSISTNLNDALSTLGAFQADDLEQEIHDHGAIDMSQNVRDGAVHGLEQLQHFLGLLVEQRLVDLCEVARLEGVERGLALQELPEVEEERLALHDGVVHGPRVRGQDLGGHEGVAVPLLLAVLLAGIAGPRGAPRSGEGLGHALSLLALVLILLVVGGAGYGLELGGDDIFEQLLEHLWVAKVVDEPGIVLLQLLHQVALVQELLELEVVPLEDLVDGRDIGVTAKPPEHVGRRRMIATSQHRWKGAARRR
jgi:hypothetical protein